MVWDEVVPKSAPSRTSLFRFLVKITSKDNENKDSLVAYVWSEASQLRRVPTNADM